MGLACSLFEGTEDEVFAAARDPASVAPIANDSSRRSASLDKGWQGLGFLFGGGGAFRLEWQFLAFSRSSFANWSWVSPATARDMTRIAQHLSSKQTIASLSRKFKPEEMYEVDPLDWHRPSSREYLFGYLDVFCRFMTAVPRGNGAVAVLG